MGACPIKHEIENCLEFGYFCSSQAECDSSNGNILENFYCSDRRVCCDQEFISTKTCSQIPGRACPSGEECEITPETTTDVPSCCPNQYDCVAIEKPEKGEQQPEEGEEKSYLWLWILIVLIILAVLGIIFRNNLRVFIFNLRNRGKASSSLRRAPPFIPPPIQGRIPIRKTIPSRPSTRTDKELDETLKKLREMSK